MTANITDEDGCTTRAGGMTGGIGWVWILLVFAVVIALVVRGTRTGFWSRDRATKQTPLEILRRRCAAGEITAPDFEHAKQAAGGAAVQDCPYLNLPGEASWPVIAASEFIT